MDRHIRSESTGIIAAFLLLAAGIVLGSVYAARAPQTADAELSKYLSGFFGTVNTQNNNFQIFKNALANNMKVFALIFLSAFFRFGIVLTGGTIALRGFVLGFTSAAVLKCYGAKGLLINACSLPSILIFIPSLIIFSIFAVRFSRIKEKKEKNIFAGFLFAAIIFATIFCICAFLDGYLTTTFMKILSAKFVNV